MYDNMYETVKTIQLLCQ